MWNFLTKHLRENKETYFSHFRFALKMFFGLFSRSMFFLIHAVFPFIPIPEKKNINGTLKWISKAKDYTDNRSLD